METRSAVDVDQDKTKRRAKPDIVSPPMVTTWGKVLEILNMITGLSFSPHFFLSDHKDIIRDLGNCMFVSLSCFLAGSASGAQLTSGTLASLPWIHPLLHQSLWCRMKAKILLVAYKVLPNLAPAYLSSLAFPSLTRLLFLLFCSSSHCPLFMTCQVSAQTPPL